MTSAEVGARSPTRRSSRRALDARGRRARGRGACTSATASSRRRRRARGRDRARCSSRATASAAPAGVRAIRDARGPARRLTRAAYPLSADDDDRARAPRRSFPSAPELPDGVEPRARRRAWPPWTAVVALVAGFAGALVGALVSASIAVAFGAELRRPAARRRHRRDGRAGPLPHRQRAAVRAACPGASAPAHFGLRPTRLWPAIGWAVARLRRASCVFTAACRRRSSAAARTTTSSPRSSASTTAPPRWSRWRPRRGHRAGRRGVLLPRLLLRRAAQLARPVAGGDRHRPRLRRDPRRLGAVAFLLPLAFFGFVAVPDLRSGPARCIPCIALHCANNSIAFGVDAGLDVADPGAARRRRSRSSAVALAVRASGRRARRRPRRRPPLTRDAPAAPRAPSATACGVAAAYAGTLRAQ